MHARDRHNQGADIPNPDADGGDSLHEAAAAGNLGGVRAMLDRGDDPNRRSFEGLIPLHLAAHHGHVEVLRALLNAGSDVNAIAPYGGTSLKFAAAKGHLGVIRVLLECGAEFDDEQSALHAAVEANQLDAVGLLIEHGANPLGGPSGRTPLDVATMLERADIVTAMRRQQSGLPHTGSGPGIED